MAVLAFALALAPSVVANSPWLQLPPMPYTPAYHALVAVDHRLYVLGGDIGSSSINKVLVFDTERGGAWSESPYELPELLAEHAAVTVGRKVYVFGGTNGKTALRTAFSAEVSSKGELGPWSSESTLLPESLRGHSAASLGHDIFVVGGRDEGGRVGDHVYRATADYSGRVQSWRSLGPLPRPLAYAGAATLGSRLYLIGGEDGSGPVETVWSAALSSTGEVTWRRQTPLPRPLSRGAAFTDGSTLFYVGGYDGNGTSASTYLAPVDSQGNVGTWTNWVALPSGVLGLRTAVLNGSVYLAGGFDGARFVSSLRAVPIDAPMPPTSTAAIPSEGEPDYLTLAMATFILVALLSLLVVTVALIKEQRKSV